MKPQVNPGAVRHSVVFVLALGAVLTCSGCPEDLERLVIYANPLDVANAAAFAATIPDDGLEVLESDDPVAGAEKGHRKAMRVAIVEDLDCTECYRIEGEGQVYVDNYEDMYVEYQGETYQYGYLHWANELCYWHKECIEAAQVIEGSDEVAPGCAW